MRVVCEMPLTSFEFWGGAIDNAKMLTFNELEMVEEMLNDLFSEGIEETQINDLFWFDIEVICDWLGYAYDIDSNEIIR